MTLRVSGLFRDVFPGLAQMFEVAAAALSARERPSDNPYLKTRRASLPQAGLYGLGMTQHLDDYSKRPARQRARLGLRWPRHAIDAKGDIHEARAALRCCTALTALYTSKIGGNGCSGRLGLPPMRPVLPPR